MIAIFSSSRLVISFILMGSLFLSGLFLEYVAVTSLENVSNYLSVSLNTLKEAFKQQYLVISGLFGLTLTSLVGFLLWFMKGMHIELCNAYSFKNKDNRSKILSKISSP